MDLTKWIGISYRDKGRGPGAYDCWGGIRAVLAEHGITLPDYADTYTAADDRASACAAVEAGLRDGWQRVERPRALDLLILNIARRPWHCGLMVGPTMFLHWPPQGTSRIERIDAPQWARRVEGYYRHESMQG